MSDYTPEQQRENRRKWVEALRSGKFKQTTGSLSDHRDSFCCLGIGCLVVDKVLDYDAVSAAMGIRDTKPFVEMNDEDCLSFAEIADAIEKRPALFTEESR